MMKKLSLFLLCVLFWACQPSAQDARQYESTLSPFQEQTFALISELEKSVTDTIYENIFAKREQLQKELHQNINQIKTQSDFDGSSKYKSAVLNYMLEVSSLAKNEYQEIMDLMLKPKAEWTEKDQKRNTKLRKLVLEKHRIALRHWQMARLEFAQKYGLKEFEQMP